MTTPPDADRVSYEPNVAAAATDKPSLVEDFIEIFYAPSRVFARRQRGGFGIPLLIITLLTALFMFASRSVFSQIFDAEFSRRTAKAMAENPRVTQEMVDRMRPMQEMIAQVFAYLITPILILVVALVVWLVAKAIKAKLSYTQSATITTFAWIPRVVSSLLGAAQVLLMDTTNVTSPYALSFSPARFMSPDTTNPKLYGIAASFDVFAIWYTILLGIGIAVIGRVPRSKGYLAAAIVFIVGIIPSLFA